MNITNYVKVTSVAEAYELNQKHNAVVLGGCCWLRLSPKRVIGTAIDLSGLGLDTVEETPTEIRLGCMVTLRQMETSDLLAALTQGALQDALRHIVGVQFRNLATIGGSICGRFGFSDLWTLFLAMDGEVELYKAGRMKLSDFAARGAERDIVTHVILPKVNGRTAYESLRLSATDFPIIACAASCANGQLRCAIGARPQRAELVPAGSELLSQGFTEAAVAAYARQAVEALTFGANLRATAAYRKEMAAVLCKRVLKRLAEEGER